MIYKIEEKRWEILVIGSSFVVGFLKTISLTQIYIAFYFTRVHLQKAAEKSYKIKYSKTLKVKCQIQPNNF